MDPIHQPNEYSFGDIKGYKQFIDQSQKHKPLYSEKLRWLFRPPEKKIKEKFINLKLIHSLQANQHKLILYSTSIVGIQ